MGWEHEVVALLLVFHYSLNLQLLFASSISTKLGSSKGRNFSQAMRKNICKVGTPSSWKLLGRPPREDLSMQI